MRIFFVRLVALLALSAALSPATRLCAEEKKAEVTDVDPPELQTLVCDIPADFDWNKAASEFCRRHYSDLFKADKVPAIHLLPPSKMKRGDNGTFYQDTWSINFNNAARVKVHGMLSHELAHAVVAFRNLSQPDDMIKFGNHGEGFMKVLIEAGFDGDARWFAQFNEKKYPGIIKAYETAAGHPLKPYPTPQDKKAPEENKGVEGGRGDPKPSPEKKPEVAKADQ